jgi:hypothetical protein
VTPQQQVDQWNSQHPPATCVRYWSFTKDDPGEWGITEGPAWILGGHTAMVRILGLDGRHHPIALTHVEVTP